ncbi:MAG: T9SS type A sorting domain-containing protein [Candidatus Glassbacteria bacterium]|nr:T9SS type A sorting domain-containing protein [Candidatus Glassbacteria bacterium]
MRPVIVCALMTLVAFHLSATNLDAQTYKGASYCLNCHAVPQGEHPAVDGAIQSYHNTSLRDPDSASVYGPPGVVSHDQWVAGLDLATTSSFAQYGENAPKLSLDQTVDPQDPTDFLSGYQVTIGEITYQVNGTYGGHGKWKQRYMTKIGESLYILPIQWNEKDQEWVTYHTDHWYDGDDLPLYTDQATLVADVVLKNSFERRCIGCHSTGIELAYDDSTGYTATYSEFNTLCERCHGAGGPSAVSFHTDGTGLMTGDLTQDQRLELCGQCHSRGSSVGTAGENKFDFPVDADLSTFTVGASLPDFWSVVNPVDNASKFWPDGVHSKSHHQQMLDFKNSGHYLDPDAQMDCTFCHDVHEAPGDHQVRDTLMIAVEGGDTLAIATNNDNNTLCLACHAATAGPFSSISKEMVADAVTNVDSIGTIVSVHTNHAYDPDGSGESRCSKCHMPKTMKSAIPHDIHAHTFQTTLPEKTLNLAYQAEGGMFNSCALSCHNKSNPWNIVDGDNAVWNESSDIELAAALNEYAVQWWGEEIAQICDFNDDGKLAISDVVTFMILARDNPLDQRLDRNIDGRYDLVDLVALIDDIWQGACFENVGNSTMLASAFGGITVEKVDGLNAEEIDYIETILKQLDLTPDQQEAFRIALYGDGTARSSLPKDFALKQNSPNPFNPATTISYSVPEGRSVDISLKVYDIRGRLVTTLVSEVKNAGTYTVFWEGASDSGRKLASGVYFYRLQAGEFMQTRKMVLLK